MALKKKDREDIANILRRRANEIAKFKADYMADRSHLGSVEMALTREIERLRDFADEIEPKFV
jgi:hypothetical protein